MFSKAPSQSYLLAGSSEVCFKSYYLSLLINDEYSDKNYSYNVEKFQNLFKLAIKAGLEALLFFCLSLFWGNQATIKSTRNWIKTRPK